MPAPETVIGLMSSIIVDMGENPDDYLIPPGPGEHELRKDDEQMLDPDEVWQGSYHEEGVYLYKEWDFNRQRHRKSWCVLLELRVDPVHDRFAETWGRLNVRDPMPLVDDLLVATAIVHGLVLNTRNLRIWGGLEFQC